MPTALIIIAQTDFQDHEYAETRAQLEAGGVECTVASITTAECTGAFGAKATPDLAVKDAKADDYDVIILIGGAGAFELAHYPEIMEIIKDAHNKGKNLAAICISPTILAKAGVLEGKKATVFLSPDSSEILEQGKAIFVDKPVVVDVKLVTANGPPAATEFGKKIVEMLK